MRAAWFAPPRFSLGYLCSVGTQADEAILR